jgi:hypothetical protein
MKSNELSERMLEALDCLLAQGGTARVGNAPEDDVHSSTAAALIRRGFAVKTQRHSTRVARITITAEGRRAYTSRVP